MSKTKLLLFFAALNLVAFMATGIGWYALGALGFLVGGCANDYLESIRDDVMRELAKKCECALCKANRSDEP